MKSRWVWKWPPFKYASHTGDKWDKQVEVGDGLDMLFLPKVK